MVSLLERVSARARGPEVCLRDVAETLGRASFIPNLMLPALAVVSPLSGIPLFSSFCGIWIALVSAQMLLHRDHVWLPGFLMRRRVSGERLRTATEWLIRPTAWLDRMTRPRLAFLLRAPFVWLAQAVCLTAGLAMPFLELFPFTSSILGAVVFLLSLAMLAHDGLLMLGALAVLAAAPAAAIAIAGG